MSKKAAESAFPRAAAACAATVIACGILVLVGGWCFGVTELLNLIPGTVVMKPSTATGLISLGASLVFLRNPGVNGWRRRAGIALALVAILIGIAFLCEYVLGWDLSIDEFPFRDQIGRREGVPYPGRLAPTTAIGLVLTGLALVSLGNRPRLGWQPAEMLMVPLAALATTSLIGYVYSLPEFYGPASATKMALNTALCFAVISVGIVLCRPHGRLLALLKGHTPGAAMARRLLPLVIALPLLLGWLRLRAEELGTVGHNAGTWWLTCATIVGMITLLWRASTRLDRADARRATLEERLRELAHRDQMTGLLNRFSFEHEMKAHAARVRRYGGLTAVMMIDLDCLKEVNDRLGHGAGDDLIRAVAGAISSRVRETDVVGRLGGDEFGVLLQADAEGAMTLAAKIELAIRAAQPESVGDEGWSTASIGVAQAGGSLAGDPETLLRAADQAMYEAKRDGGGRVVLAGASNPPALSLQAW